MQGRIGEHCVELVLEVESAGVPDPGVESAGPRRRNLRLARIDGHNVGALGGELLGQGAVATPEVQDPQAGDRPQKFHHGSTEIRHEPGVARVTLGIPVLPGACLRPSRLDWRHVVFHRTHRWCPLRRRLPGRHLLVDPAAGHDLRLAKLPSLLPIIPNSPGKFIQSCGVVPK